MSFLLALPTDASAIISAWLDIQPGSTYILFESKDKQLAISSIESETKVVYDSIVISYDAADWINTQLAETSIRSTVKRGCPLGCVSNSICNASGCQTCGNFGGGNVCVGGGGAP